MKANIFEIKRFAVHDGDGVRTTVFFKGCPLSCVWCHNPESLKKQSELSIYQHKCVKCGNCVRVCPNGAHAIKDDKHVFIRENCIACGKCEEECYFDAIKLYGKEYSVDDLLPILLQDIDFYKDSNGGVTLSGGECLLQYEFCTELLKKLKEHGINTAVDTCGCVSKTAIDSVLPYVDTFLYDVKAFDEDVHKRCTGVSNKAILENLKYLDDMGAKVEIRIPYVPAYNDNQIEKIAEFIKSLKNVTAIKVLAYHNYASSKYEAIGVKNTLPQLVPTEEDRQRAVEIIRRIVDIKVS
ncbi:MAG: glycyl-radical enzyme activating protein [Clostridia bacterium]|nr:glycyl-radical enzyme activating protein [Clostridia bacterium]